MALYSASVEYGLHCLLYLVGLSKDSKLSSLDLAEFQGISPSYVAKLFTQFKHAGLVTAIEGAGGGYRLARGPGDITVLDIVKALEGNKPLFQCKEIRRKCDLLGVMPPSWSTKGICSIHAVMREAEQQMLQTLKRYTLADMAQRVGQQTPKAFVVQMQRWFEGRQRPNSAARRRSG